MLFNSYIFIFLFLPLCLAGFYLLQKKSGIMAKVWLTAFSLWFYGYFNLHYLLIMVCSIVGNYLFHGWILKARQRENIEQGRKRSRQIMTAGICLNLVVLFYYKYFDFFLESVNRLTGSRIALRGILLPLGISFFTFQQISFLADTYRGEMDVYLSRSLGEGKNRISFVDYALFVSFFPQLIAGPIVVHEEMFPQFARIGRDTRSREDRLRLFAEGCFIFVLGMAKKVLIADTFGAAVDFAYGDVTALNGLESFLTVIFYSLQLYFDFSGYCDMAKGIAQMFGMKIADNFDSPYKSVNIVEFWKRWHITLSRFFTKNVYIPLGGNRKGRFRMYVNYLLVFFLSGLWHGAGWNFILWGLLHGILYVITKWRMLRRSKANTGAEPVKKGKISGAVSVILTFSYVSIAWVYFRAAGISEANCLLRNIFTKTWSLPGSHFIEAFNLGEFWYVLKILKISTLPYAEYYLTVLFTMAALGIVFFGKNTAWMAKRFKPVFLNGVMTAVLFWWCIVSLSGVSTFLYFNF